MWAIDFCKLFCYSNSKKNAANTDLWRRKMTEYTIERAKLGDEEELAYIQTESWKAGFKDILRDRKSVV